MSDTHPPRRRWLLAFAVGAAVLVVLSVVLWSRPERAAFPVTAEGPGPRPSETARAVAPPPDDGSAPAADDDSAGGDEELAAHRLWVVTGALTKRTRYTAVATQQLDSWRFWPLPDEAPLPDAPSVALHQQILDFEAEPRTFDEAYWARRGEIAEVRDQMIEQARLDGLTPRQVDAVDHPWEALFAAEVELRWRRAERSVIVAEHQEAMREAADAGKRRPRFEIPLVELDEMAALAGEIRDHHPDEPVADYAALYLLEACSNSVSTLHSPEDTRALIADVAASTTDPLVLDHAVALLDAGDMDDSTRVLLQQRFEATADPEIEAALARTLADDAFAREDWDVAEDWVLELRARRADLCPESAPLGCHLLDNEIAQSLAQIAVARGERPDRWDAALGAAAWRCHLALPLAGSPARPGVPRPVYEIHGRSIWADGDWTWWSWSQEGGELDTAFSDCIERETSGLPGPPPPDRAILRVTRL